MHGTQERCPATIADYADQVQAGVLKGGNANICVDIVEGCTEPTAQMFNRTYLKEHFALESQGGTETAEETITYRRAMRQEDGLSGLAAENPELAAALKGMKIEL